MSHLVTGWVTPKVVSAWVIPQLGTGYCTMRRWSLPRAPVLKFTGWTCFLQKTLGAWIFLHVKEVWVHASSQNWVCKYIKCLIWKKKTKTFHRGKPLLENDSEAASIMKWLFHDREEWEMVLSLVFPIFSLLWSTSDIWAVKDAWEKAGKLWVCFGSFSSSGIHSAIILNHARVMPHFAIK